MNNEQSVDYHINAIRSLASTQTRSLGLEIEKIARDKPLHIAMFYDERKITYQEFNNLANRYANYFIDQGFKKGDVVALLMSNRPEYLIAVTGLSKLGVVTALINSEVRGEVLAAGINLVDAKAVIIGHEFVELYQTIAERVRLYKPARLMVETENQTLKFPDNYEDLNKLLQTASQDNPFTSAEINSDDVLAIMFTAGTFGDRKAVQVLQKRFLSVGHKAAAFCHMHGDRVLYMSLPLHLNSGFNLCFGSMAVSGCSMVIKKRFSVSQFWDDIHKYQADYFVGVGEMCRYIYSMPQNSRDTDNPLEIVICNGMWGGLIEPFRKRFNVEHVIEIYGTSEGVGSFINHQEVLGMCGNLTLGGIRQGEVARCNFDTGELMRDDNGWVIKCEPGRVGVLLCEINDLNPFTGYIKDEEGTEAKIVSNAFRDGDEYLNTFDLVELEEGDYISFVDRLGDTYRWKGKTVSAHQVADVIIKYFGPIEDATVFGVKIPGLEGRCGMAAIKFLEGEKMEWNKFLHYLNSRMPEHARPLFFRIIDQVEGDDLLEEWKMKYKKDGFSPDVVKDPIFYLDPVKEAILPLTSDVYKSILENKIQF